MLDAAPDAGRGIKRPDCPALIRTSGHLSLAPFVILIRFTQLMIAEMVLLQAKSILTFQHIVF